MRNITPLFDDLQSEALRAGPQGVKEISCCFLIRPVLNYVLFSTPVIVSSKEAYPASHATNIPDWRRQKLVFLHEREFNPVGLLLKDGEYEILPYTVNLPTP